MLIQSTDLQKEAKQYTKNDISIYFDRYCGTWRSAVGQIFGLSFSVRGHSCGGAVAASWPLSSAFWMTEHVESSDKPVAWEKIAVLGSSLNQCTSRERKEKGKAPGACLCCITEMTSNIHKVMFLLIFCYLQLFLTYSWQEVSTLARVVSINAAPL